MKKIVLALLTITVCIASTTFGFAATTPRVVINGESVSFPDAQPFVDQNNRTQVPIKFITEKMNGSVDWNGYEKKVTLNVCDRTITMWLDNEAILVGDKMILMDTAPISKNGRTYVPIKFISDAIGAKTTWDGTNKIVGINYTSTNSYQNITTQQYNTEYYQAIAKIDAMIDEAKAYRRSDLADYDKAIQNYKSAIALLESKIDSVYEDAYEKRKQMIENAERKGITSTSHATASSDYLLFQATDKVSPYANQKKEYQEILDDLIEERAEVKAEWDDIIKGLEIEKQKIIDMYK